MSSIGPRLDRGHRNNVEVESVPRNSWIGARSKASHWNAFGSCEVSREDAMTNSILEQCVKYAPRPDSLPSETRFHAQSIIGRKDRRWDSATGETDF
ncbi:hypothetical protein YTPLAS18_05410 [Nitrospira sp.]|nr:hypothetical protein YTPLAS18_05410 [Nitrospira sp.]